MNDSTRVNLDKNDSNRVNQIALYRLPIVDSEMALDVVADWIRLGFSKIAQEAHEGLGAIPIERLLAGHLPFLTAVRSTGATWVEIARAMSSNGLAQRNGRPLSGDQLRGVYSRLQRRTVEPPLPPLRNDASAEPTPVPGPAGSHKRRMNEKPPAADTFNSEDRIHAVQQKLARIAQIRGKDPA